MLKTVVYLDGFGKCPGCKTVKPFEDFIYSYYDGAYKYCRECNKLKGVANRNKCCDILEKHHNDLKDDPERLTTDFIKKISRCNCKVVDFK
jgi:hypothetical protein